MSNLRDFTKYPVYTQEEIAEAHLDASNLTLEARKLGIELQAKKEKLGLEWEELDEDLKNESKEYFYKYYESTRLWNVYRVMIENNLAVINGKKTIYEAESALNLFDENVDDRVNPEVTKQKAEQHFLHKFKIKKPDK